MNPWYIDPIDLTIRLILAVLLGGLVGLEREKRNRAAGFRTHILVCVGSTLVMLLSMYGFSSFAEESNANMDPSRMATGVVTGIGFLGAGVILRVGVSISGLTTAASLWIVAAIGLSVGAGFYYAAGLTTTLVLFSLLILNKVEEKWIHVEQDFSIGVRTIDKPSSLGNVLSILEKHHIEIKKVSMKQQSEEDMSDKASSVEIIFVVQADKLSSLTPIADDINKLQEVSKVRID